MRKIIFCLLAFTLVACGSPKNNKGATSNTNDGSVADAKVRSIKLAPDKNNELKLSEIAKDLRIIPLETTEQSLLAGFKKIEIDEGLYFIQSQHDDLVYVFNGEGKFVAKIGRIGRGPGELLFPMTFALDRKKKEVILVDNAVKYLKYDYNGKFLENYTLDRFFFKDFIVLDSGDMIFHTSKNANFDKDEKPINYNLRINSGEDHKVYFPYNYDKYPNGSMRFETLTPFSSFGDTIRYHYVFSDTIYTIDGSKVSPAYVIDYSGKDVKVDFNEMTGEEVIGYLKRGSNEACYTQNVIESESWLRFSFAISANRQEVFFNKKDNSILEGFLVDDIFGTLKMAFMTHNGGKIVGLIRPEDMKLKDKASRIFNGETLNFLKNISNQDNPFIIEFTPSF